jgi:hypothetical protein
MTPAPKESLSEYVERLMGEPKRKTKPIKRYEDLRDEKKRKRG